jgi:hypothetical protein
MINLTSMTTYAQQNIPIKFMRIEVLEVIFYKLPPKIQFT